MCITNLGQLTLPQVFKAEAILVQVRLEILSQTTRKGTDLGPGVGSDKPNDQV